MKKRLFSIITALALCLTLLPATALAADGDVTYRYCDADGTNWQTGTKSTSEYTKVTSDDASWGTNDTITWYVAQGEVIINKRVDVKGHVHLILADNCRLTINNGIQVNDLTPVNTSLTIYGQSEPVLNMDGTLNEESNITGKLIADASWLHGSYTGIGPSGGSVACKLTINGGTVKATGGTGGAGTGGAGIGCATTINGGYVEATGGTDGAGITGHITINGGTVKATGGTGSAGIGGNRNRNGGTITITGGTVTANGGADGAGIGGGYKGDGGEITISGGTVTAKGGQYGAGIGGGARATGSTTGGNGGTITISGGKVTATSSSHGAGIGGGSDGSGGAITISDNADITATGGEYGAGIGGGKGGTGGEITISGGTVKATGTSAAGIGGGSGGNGGTIKISGSADVTATGSGTYGGAGIGGGSQGSDGGEITISGGTVKATGGINCAGIGGGNGTYGSGGSGGTIKISAGTVTATGGSDYGGAGIGGGTAGSSGTITISGGTVTANGTGSTGSAGIGGGGGGYGDEGGAAETITISGGTVTANGSNGAAGIGGGKGYNGNADGAPGTFTTTESGNAIIKASSIAANDDKTGWSGIIFEGSDGGVYGSQTLSGSFTVGSGEKLLIAENATLTTNSKLTNNGAVYVDGSLSGTVSGNVYYPLTLINCTASAGTSTYLGNTYAEEGATVKLTATFPNPSNQFVRSWVADPRVGTGGGNYYDISSMPANAVTVKANIEDALTINTQPQDVTITYGEQTTLSVDVSRNSFISGAFLLSYQWYENDAEISGANSNSYTPPTDLPAGSHTYTCKIICDRYNVTSNTATVTVNKAAGSVTITGDPGKAYNGQPAALTAEDYTVTDDGTVTVQYKVKGADDSTYTETAPTNAGDYTVKVTKAAGTNYAEASATKDFTISRKPVTVSGITAIGKTYDGKATATLVYTNAVFTGKLESDTLSVTATGTFEDKNVGTDKTVNITGLTLGGASAGNYILAAEGQQSTTTATISPRPVTVTIDAKSSAYGAAIAELTATDDGIVDGDTDVYALATSATSSSPVGTYDITGEGKSANYDFTFGNGTGAYTITAASQSATVTMEGWTYGDTPNEPVVTGNAENGAVTYRYKVKDGGYLTEKPTDAGSYTVEATIAATANYQEAVVSDDFTIAKKELTVTGLTATDRVYAAGNTTVELAGGVLSGIVSGDEEQVAAAMPTTGTITDANADENKSVDFGTITLTGTKAGNYTLTQPTVTVTISKADPGVGEVSYAGDTLFTTTPLSNITLSRTNGTTAGTLELTANQALTAGTAAYGWTFTPNDSTNYKTVTGTISLTVEVDTLSGISIGDTAPSKTEYKYGETFQTKGLTVTATYASGNTRDVTDQVTFGALAVGDTSIELSYQGKTCTVSGLTVSKADARELSAISVKQKYTITSGEKAIGTAGMPADAGTLTYDKGTETTTGTVTVTRWDVNSTGEVTFTLSGGAVNDTVTLPIEITSTNYADSTVNVKITLTDKDTPTATANDITVTYTGSAVPDSSITGTASVEGSWSFKAAAPVTVADSSDSVTVVFTPTDALNYTTVEDIIQVTINKATPTGRPAYTAITSSGKTLADAALAVGSIDPTGGSIAWDLGDSQTVSANTAYKWTYTPTDENNYNKLTGSITPYVVSYSGGGSSSGGGGGSSSSNTTTKNPDGSTTTTTTDKNTGTVTETTKNTDGSTTTVETKKDGTVTETVKTTDGTSGTVTTDKNGNVTEAKATISTTAAKEAAKIGEAVTLPVEVPTAKNTGDAPSVEINMPKNIGSVKVEIPVEKVTPGTVAVIVNADGTEKIVSTSVVTDNGVALKVDGSATVKIIDNAKSFTDVPATNVFFNEISSLSARNIMIGVSDEKFNLNGKVTLDQIANVAGRITGAVDVKDFNSGISWGKTNGLKSGSDSATRGDVLKALYIAAGSPAVTDTSILAQFKDSVPEDLKAIAAWAAQNGILKGNIDSNGVLTANLDTNVTRGQACALAGRTLNTIG